MSKKILYWLQHELPHWQEKGWISQENADKLLISYAGKNKKESSSIWQYIVLSLAGIIFALGLFFVFAGLWYTFTPNARYSWSQGFLAISLLLVILAMSRGKAIPLLREGAGVIFYITILSTIFMLGDTYYIGETKGIYLLYSALLTLPIAYALESSMAMAFYALTIGAWSMSASAIGFYYLGVQWIWPLLILMVPFFFLSTWRESAWTQGKIFLSWAAILSVYIAFYASTADENISNDILLMSNLSVITMSLGWLGKDKGFWTKPFKIIGFVGMVIAIYFGTLTKTWIDLAMWSNMSFMAMALVALTLVASGYFAWQLVKAKQFTMALVACLGYVVMGCALMALSGMSAMTISIIFDLYILIAASSYTARGTLQKKPMLVNMALISIGAMVLARFFDPNFTFVERGISFVVIAVILLVGNIANLLRVKQKRSSFNKRVKRAKKNIMKKEIESDKTLPLEENTAENQNITEIAKEEGEENEK